jgi:hypothetical protein
MVKYKIAPLSGSFMLASLLGFAISAVWVYPVSKNFGISFLIVFIAMFIASIISMTKGPETEELRMDIRQKPGKKR